LEALLQISLEHIRDLTHEKVEVNFNLLIHQRPPNQCPTSFTRSKRKMQPTKQLIGSNEGKVSPKRPCPYYKRILQANIANILHEEPLTISEDLE